MALEYLWKIEIAPLLFVIIFLTANGQLLQHFKAIVLELLINKLSQVTTTTVAIISIHVIALKVNKLIATLTS